VSVVLNLVCCVISSVLSAAKSWGTMGRGSDWLLRIRRGRPPIVEPVEIKEFLQTKIEGKGIKD
jgi:hypothetical protein